MIILAVSIYFAAALLLGYPAAWMFAAGIIFGFLADNRFGFHKH